MSRSATLSDQAGELRRIVERQKQKGKSFGNLKTLTVLSGKGGVGKSNISINLACAMAEQDKKIVLLDADLGLANLDMLCGITAKYNLSHLIDGSKRLEDVLVSLENNIWMLPGGSGIKELADLDEGQLVELIDNVGFLEDRADVLLVDTGGGIHKSVLSFASAADTVVLVTTPEPTAIRDAYGILKALKNSGESREKKDIVFVVNMANSEREGQEVANRLKTAASQFLELPVSYIGCILKDSFVEQAVRVRKPFYRLFPDSPAAKCVRSIVGTLSSAAPRGDFAGVGQPRGLKAFFYRLARGYFVGR
ncbi:MAG: MinD/ParA family protein [Synergistaceae bacterium]|nr:MinD/ParA family protein [Synergistaceae bacterium]